MARFRISRKKAEDDWPVVSDDFIYNVPGEPDVPAASETPEEALRKLRHTDDGDREKDSGKEK